MTPAKAINRLRGLAYAIRAEGDELVLTPEAPDCHLPATFKAWLVDHKADVLALLRAVPSFTIEDEKVLVDWYCSRPRAERLAVHRRANAIEKDRGWPRREADLLAMREHRDRGAAP